MKKNTKKKVLTLALVLALLAIAVVGGSLAWFTDSDEATNTFTVGSVEIVQHEKQHNENGQLVDFVQDKMLLPIVNIGTPSADPNFQEKIVTVENTGKNDAYIRTYIAIPTALREYIRLEMNLQDWTYINYKTTEIDGMSYDAFYYDYDKALKANAGDESTTAVLLKGVYLDAVVDLKENPRNNGVMEFCKPNANGGFDFSGFPVTDATKINVYVATQACQVDGFTGTVTETLNTVFPDLPSFVVE